MPRPLVLAMVRWLPAALGLLAPALAQAPRELAIRASTPVIDGDLSEWPPGTARVRLDAAEHLSAGQQVWSGGGDASVEFLITCDAAHLYIAGLVRDDQIAADLNLATTGSADRVEVWLQSVGDGDGNNPRSEVLCLHFMPLVTRRPWCLADPTGGEARQAGSQLSGIGVVGRRLDDASYQFEAAIPFHHIPSLRPGCESLGFNLVLRDHDERDRPQPAVLSWAGHDPAAPGFGLLRLPAPGPMVSSAGGTPLWSDDLLEDLPFLLVPLASLLVLVLLLRGWRRLRARARWLRPALVACGVLVFLAGLLLPGQLGDWRARAQRASLNEALGVLQHTIGKLEQGTLASYRGASRDRALVDLLSGRAIARQRYTSYRSLAQIVPEHFGPRLRVFDDLPLRPYWIPLSVDRPGSFPFDPPLQGTTLHLVVGRPFVPAFTFAPRPFVAPRIRIELDYGGGDRRAREIDLDRPFADGGSIGREFWEVCVVPLPLERDLRALNIVAERGTEISLVGMSLEGAQGAVEPLLLGAPSLGGVLTDLRGPFPQDAGIELAPGAVARVAVTRLEEPPQKLWFFYHAIYPGVPTANPGAKVAEVVLHFADGVASRRIEFEHQVSMFYELAVHNTRDEPPDGSPAAIALSWVDDKQEKHVNLVCPVVDLPAGASIEAIEFRNVAEYRMRFRSVVLGNERAAAPQDPVDAPLVREGQDRRLRSDVLDRLRGTPLAIYRGGRLSETTLPLELRQDMMSLPRSVTGAEQATTAAVLRDGSRHVVVYSPLGGDGWDGAVLAAVSLDREWSSAGVGDNRLGFVLCLLGTPFVLVLLSELLVAATNLRFRLMAVMSVASLVPLGVLSLVLVQVLEGGHDSDVQEGLLSRVKGTMGQLEDQKERVKASARQWLHDLAQLASDRLDSVPAGDTAGLTAVRSELQKLLAGQLPPEWGGGFLRLEWQRAPGAAAEPLVLLAGDERMANVETPARLEPGVLMQWGVLMLGVRAEEAVRGGTLSLTAGRPFDGDLLGALAAGQVAMLTDVRGYPLAVSSGRPDAELLFTEALDPMVMSQREAALAAGVEQRKPVVERLASPSGRYVCASEVLRDLQDTPRGLLVLAQPDQRATLDLAIGRVPVRAFFLLVAGSLVVLAAFLSYVVSGRISRPIERLELGAQALSRGALDARVPVDGGGQIGRLTRTFNQMAADLQARLQDLQALNRTMRELSANDDDAATIDVLLRFCSSHTAADVVRIALADNDGTQLAVHSGAGLAHVPASGLTLARLLGPFSMAPRRGGLPEDISAILPACRSLIGFPIVFGSRTRGLVLLGFQRGEPLSVDVELLGTVVAQAAIAFERSQLHRLAVQDPVTGAFTPEYFRRLVVDEVSLAQQRGRSLSMLAMGLGDGERRPRGLRRFAALLRERLPEQSLLCHVGAGQFQAVLPGIARAAAEASVAMVSAAWSDLVRQLPENEVEEQPPVGVVVQFPDEAPSAEFLFEALRARLQAVRTPGASAMESDESLQRAGVTAVSPAMRAVYGTLRRVAPTDLPILLEGETGVGKEVLTNLLHRWSRRAGGPLIKVHCAALSETLLASELFGHEKGAFTGADRRKIGRFEQADGGTLFLDEVGDIPLDVQVKLLRVLQEREIDRVGGTEPVRVDVRVITATNRDIGRLVAEGRFREDLYYRLQGVVVRVPPLRERKQELRDLVEHFRREAIAGGQSHARSLSTEAMDELYRQDWPGNIRELRNTVLRAMVLARGEVVAQRDILQALAGRSAAATEQTPTNLEPAAAVGPVAPRIEPVAPRIEPPVPAPPDPAAAHSAARRAEPSAPGAPAGGDEGTGQTNGEEATYVLPGAVPLDLELEQGPVVPISPDRLPARLRELFDRIVQRGSYSTHDHMQAAGVSHRTGLRDLQALVQAGLVERVGSRRGAHYRPTKADDRFSKGRG